MEVKVWVEGLQKTICGVTPTTTCHDLVLTLAHATGKRGRFVLTEKWGKNERTVPPSEKILSSLQQKAEFNNEVQFILKCPDSTNASQRKSASPQVAQPTESPFQRPSANGSSGIFRKSLTPRGVDYVAPKIVKTRAEASTENFSNGLKENNLPSDLNALKSQQEPKKGSLSVETKSNISKSGNMLLNPAPSVSGSMESPQNSSPVEMPKKVVIVTTTRGPVVDNPEETNKRKAAKREELKTSIRQHEEQLRILGADGTYFDRELVLWEEKASSVVKEVENLESQIAHYRSIEGAIAAEIKELLAMDIERQIRDADCLRTGLELELDSVKKRMADCETEIQQMNRKAQETHQQLLTERELLEKQGKDTEDALRREKGILLKELADLAAIHDKETHRLEEMRIEETRLDSNILAKTLEMDSLEDAWRRSSNAAEKQDDVKPVSAAYGSYDTVNGTVTATHDDRNSPVPSTRKVPQHQQRLIVLKRNTAHDPQGMWV